MKEAHSIFVTGVEFMPSSEGARAVTGGQDFTLLSISADNTIKIHQVAPRGTTSQLFKYTVKRCEINLSLCLSDFKFIFHLCRKIFYILQSTLYEIWCIAYKSWACKRLCIAGIAYIALELGRPDYRSRKRMLPRSTQILHNQRQCV